MGLTVRKTTEKAVRVSFRSLKNYFNAFCHDLRRKRPETRGTYERALRAFLRWFAIDKKFGFLVKDVERYKKYLTKDKKLSQVSVSTYLTALRRFCQYLVDIRLLQKNPAREVGGNRRPSSHSREALTYRDVDALLVAIDRSSEIGLRDYTIIRMMLGCGLSEIELIRADVGDIKDVDGKSVTVVQGKGRDVKDEQVVIPEDVKSAIDEYLALRASEGGSQPDGHQPLFLSAGNRTRGKRMSTRGIRERVNYYLDVARIKRGRVRILTPYSLRHTAALMMVESGATVEELKERMRLGSIATAMIYFQQPRKLGRQQKVA